MVRICVPALPGKYTTAEIAKAAGLREDQVTHRLRHGLGRPHGIGHNGADNGVITLVLPEGVPAEALVAGEARAAAKAKTKPEAAKGKLKPATERRV